MRSGARTIPRRRWGVMLSSSSGGLWIPRLLGILTLSALPQESLECVFKQFLDDCTITDLPVFRYSEQHIEEVPDSVPEDDTITVRKCKEPAVENGISHASGEKMTFECKIGYFLIGSYFIQCKNNIWHPKVPSCKKIAPNLCGAPVIPSGKVEPLLPEYNTTNIIYLHCNKNYSFPDETIEMKTKCHGYNVWEPPPQPCFIRTSHDTSVLHISNGKVSKGRKKFYEPGDNVTITCNPGYALSGPSNVRYIGGGKWSPEIPDCSLNAFFTLLITAFVLIIVLVVVQTIYQKCRSP